jgi:hypothetical protein
MVPVAHSCDRVLAELGDKTQLATLLYAAEQSTSKVGVFIERWYSLASLLSWLVPGFRPISHLAHSSSLPGSASLPSAFGFLSTQEAGREARQTR